MTWLEKLGEFKEIEVEVTINQNRYGVMHKFELNDDKYEFDAAYPLFSTEDD